MRITVLVRTRLTLTEAAARQSFHDASFTPEAIRHFQTIGVASHQTLANPVEPQEVLGVDVWEGKTLEEIRAFYNSPEFDAFSAHVRERPPEVQYWTDPGWKRW